MVKKLYHQQKKCLEDLTKQHESLQQQIVKLEERHRKELRNEMYKSITENKGNKELLIQIESFKNQVKKLEEENKRQSDSISQSHIQIESFKTKVKKLEEENKRQSDFISECQDFSVGQNNDLFTGDNSVSSSSSGVRTPPPNKQRKRVRFEDNKNPTTPEKPKRRSMRNRKKNK